MITNVQIVTDEGTVTAVVEEDKILAAYQNMRTIPIILMENYVKSIGILDLSHNKLRDLSSLRCLPSLHTLVVDHNLLTSTSFIPWLPSLKILWLNFNLISDLSVFLPILSSSCPHLQHLSFMGNMAMPITHREEGDRHLEKYRQYVIRHLKHLQYLDDRPVSHLERLKDGNNNNKISAYLQETKNTLHNIKVSVMARFNRCNGVV